MEDCGPPYLLISGQSRKCNGGQKEGSSLHFCGQFGPVFFADLLSVLRNCLPFWSILYLLNYGGKEISRFFLGGIKTPHERKSSVLQLRYSENGLVKGRINVTEYTFQAPMTNCLCLGALFCKSQPIETCWLNNSCIVYERKTKGFAWSWTFQPKPWHLCLLH